MARKKKITSVAEAAVELRRLWSAGDHWFLAAIYDGVPDVRGLYELLIRKTPGSAVFFLFPTPDDHPDWLHVAAVPKAGYTAAQVAATLSRDIVFVDRLEEGLAAGHLAVCAATEDDSRRAAEAFGAVLTIGEGTR